VRRQRLEIKGMTCEHCALSIEAVLEDAGAEGVFVDYRRGFAEFDPEGVDLEKAREFIRSTGYEAGELDPIEGNGKPKRVEAVTSDDEATDYDLAIIGAGAAAFAAAIQAIERGARVVMIEHGTVGGTCVNIGCVPSKAMLRAGEIYNVAGRNPHRGVPTSTGRVELAELVTQKDELVERMRQEKYCDLIDDYGWDLVKGHAEFADAETLLVDGEPLRARAYLIAAGARPAIPPIAGLEQAGYATSTSGLELKEHTDKLGLERAGIELTERGAIAIDETLRTTNPRVFAAGDITPAPQFVYVAAAQGAMAAVNAIEDETQQLDYRALPRVTFTHPQVAAVGLTEAQAREQGLEVDVRTLPLESVPRAAVNLDTRGLVKLVAETEGGRIVGATAVAENAGDVILAAVYAVQFGLTVDDVSRTWAPYLTMSEAFKLAAQIFSRDVSKLSCCAA